MTSKDAVFLRRSAPFSEFRTAAPQCIFEIDGSSDEIETNGSSYTIENRKIDQYGSLRVVISSSKFSSKAHDDIKHFSPKTELMDKNGKDTAASQ